tara:strand:- start:1474 stop:1650 length:177 start_codon:yes stop_codon:yes gene_type:complete
MLRSTRAAALLAQRVLLLLLLLRAAALVHLPVAQQRRLPFANSQRHAARSCPNDAATC